MTGRICGPAVFLLLLWFSPESGAQERRREDDVKVQLDQLVQACVQSEKRDDVCNTLIQVHQIGDDAVEAIKAFVHLGPFEYAVLTAANFAATGRLRVRPQPILRKDVQNTIDYNKDGIVTIVLEKNF